MMAHLGHLGLYSNCLQRCHCFLCWDWTVKVHKAIAWRNQNTKKDKHVRLSGKFELLSGMCVGMYACTCFCDISGHFYDDTPSISGQMEKWGHFSHPHFHSILECSKSPQTPLCLCVSVCLSLFVQCVSVLPCNGPTTCPMCTVSVTQWPVDIGTDPSSVLVRICVYRHGLMLFSSDRKPF